MTRATDIPPDLLVAREELNPLAVGPRLAAVYELTKPRLNFLVLVTTAVGYYVAAGPESFGHPRPFVHALLGTALTAAGSGVLNQFVEREADALMPRTRRRPLPAGTVSPAFAATFGIALGVLGTAYLAALVNGVAAALAAITLLSYVLVYTPLKRVTPWSTHVGAVPGAIPPMIGVAAVTNSITPLAWALFALMVCWQMPHFFGLATLYKDDYARGGFRMLPGEADGERRTARHVLLFSLLLLPASLLPCWADGIGGGIGWFYGVAATGLGAWFLEAGVRMARQSNRATARRLFVVSILYLPLLLVALVLDRTF